MESTSFVRGERFHIPLDEDDDQTPSFDIPNVGEVKERSFDSSTPTPPSLKSRPSGFPTHKKRTGPSLFKQRKAGISKGNHQTAGKDFQQGPIATQDSDSLERQRIHEENTRKLMEMSPDEIEQERQELFEGLPPSLIQRLLERSNIDDTSGADRHLLNSSNSPSSEGAIASERASGTGSSKPSEPPGATGSPLGASSDTEQLSLDDSVSREPTQQSSTTKKVTFKVPETSDTESQTTPADSAQREPGPVFLASDIHFPSARHPELDPTSPNFLEDLHEKYFPDLQHDKSKLDWLTPLPEPDSKEDLASPYHPSKSDVSPEEIRFDFKGALLPPRLSRQLPVNIGLHHHGDAPEAAGYTIPELSRLSRSQVPSQRCMAFLTLGRILYRLGVGQFGDENLVDAVDEEGYGDGGAILAKGLWTLMDDGKVIETLTEEVNRKDGHMSAKAYAQEALWNWRRGGGRMRKAV